MRWTRAIVGWLLVVTAVVASGAATAHAQGAGTLTVRPLSRLVGGDTVHLTASGVTPGASVQVVECDQFAGDGINDCSGTTSATADQNGDVATEVTLADPVYRSHEFGDATPVYCRAQVCRLFVVWTDADGQQQVMQSSILGFRGAPAVIVVKPSGHLRASQLVGVYGSAHGASGHRVQVFEETCIDIIQGHGCEQVYPAATTRIGRDGKYATHYRVRRFLPDGRDCTSWNDMAQEWCQLTTVVLTDGQPDYSFGDPTWGDPHGLLWFRNPAS